MYTEEVQEHETPFPILAKIIRTGESVVFKSSAEIPAGVAIKILKRNIALVKEAE